MGIKKLNSVLTAIVKANSGSATPFSSRGFARADIAAIDANMLLYWAIDIFMLSKHVTSGTTKLSNAEINEHIVSAFMTVLKDLIRILVPSVLVIALDGVPPLAKIVEQRRRRMESAATGDVLMNPDLGEVVFSRAWISPYSDLMSLLDNTIRSFLADPAHHYCTIIYSGPATPGEGEHKIYPILKSLVLYGINGMKISSSHAPLKIQIVGNDNDIYLLSLLFLASFRERCPQLFVYNDRSTRNTLATSADSKSARGTGGAADPESKDIRNSGAPKISKVEDMFFNNINLLFGLITDPENPFYTGTSSAANQHQVQLIDESASETQSSIDVVIRFVYLTSFLGNDFVPKMTMLLETDVDRTQSDVLMRHLCSAGRMSASWYSGLGALRNVDISKNTITPIRMAADYDVLIKLFTIIHWELQRSSMSICGGLRNENTDREMLVDFALYNAHEPYLDANRLAFAASVDYVLLLDAVMSYYVTSTFCVPANHEVTYDLTMPNMYYAYGRCPPTFIYLSQAAGFLANAQKTRKGSRGAGGTGGTSADKPFSLGAASASTSTKGGEGGGTATMESLTGIYKQYSLCKWNCENLEPVPFLNRKMHANLIMPRAAITIRPTGAHAVGARADAMILPWALAGIYPVGVDPRLNANMFVYEIIVHWLNMSSNYAQILRKDNDGMDASIVLAIADLAPMEDANFKTFDIGV